MNMGFNLQNNLNNLIMNNIDLNKREINDSFNILNLDKYYKYANKFNGIFMPKKVMYLENIKNYYKFKCFNNHTFKLIIEDIEKKKWCEICENNYNKLEELIKKNKAIIINKNININYYILKCKYNHKFKLDTNKYPKFQWKWCQQCYSLKEKKKRIKKQEKIFKKLNNKYSKYLISISSNKEINYQKKYEALNFCNGKILISWGLITNDKNLDTKEITNKNCNLENKKKAFLDIFIKLDSFLIKNYLQNFNENWKKNLFRICCLLLHPDKNDDIASKEAFIKLLTCFKN